MVSIDMEIPSCCMNCRLLGREEMYCSIYPRRDLDVITVATNRPNWCPLVEIEERKVGKWLVKDNGNGDKYVECPFCGALAPCTEFADRTVWKYSKFCYDCGNELRGVKSEE